MPLEGFSDILGPFESGGHYQEVLNKRVNPGRSVYSLVTVAAGGGRTAACGTLVVIVLGVGRQRLPPRSLITHLDIAHSCHLAHDNYM